jgi:hypothetical protein
MDRDFPKILEPTSNWHLLHVRNVFDIILPALCVTTSVAEPETWLE